MARAIEKVTTKGMAGETSLHKQRTKVKNSMNGSDDMDSQIFPLAVFLWPARNSTSQWNTLPLILMVVGLFRWAAGLWGYSGYQNPPKFGDFEAQRHWMEITTQLPISQWYFYDLEWWGLDYPPLTAYHSWLLGKIGTLIGSEWFALDTSRGNNDPNLKIFMRATVILSEYLVYIPAMVVFVQKFSRAQRIHSWNSTVALVAILLQPGLLLIDHTHFQYNNVMLGFIITCLNSALAGRLKWSCLFFVLALGFKQMSLYYAPAVFAYLLGVCIFPRIKISQLLGIVITTFTSFLIILLPLSLGALYDAYRGTSTQIEASEKSKSLPMFAEYSYLNDVKVWYYPIMLQLTQILHRIFPFSRGLFEDKVANFWCALNVVVKIRNFPLPILQQVSLVATSVAILPPCLIIFFKPRVSALPLAFSTTAWGFFIFSFQVHEKSVLLPLMPMTILLASKNGLSQKVRAWVGFANLLGVWTMFPLLQRVNLRIPYYVLSLLWAYLLGLPPTSFNLYFRDRPKTPSELLTTYIHSLYYFSMIMWHILEALIIPPLEKPDLWTVLNVEIGATGFFLCYIWCIWNLVKECGLLNPTLLKKTQKSSESCEKKLKCS